MKPNIQKLIKKAKEAHKGELFLGAPKEWLDNPHWWCKNGHLSTRTLRRSEGPHRDVCLACFGQVWLGPKELSGVTPK